MKWPPRYLQPLVKRLDRVRRGRRVCLRLRERAFALVFVNVASLVCVCMHVQGHLRVLFFFSLPACVHVCFMCVRCVQCASVCVHRGYHHTMSVLLLASLLQAQLYGTYSGQLVCRYIGSLWPSRCSAKWGDI